MTTAIQFLSDSNAVGVSWRYDQRSAVGSILSPHRSQTKGQTEQSGPRKTQHLSIAENGHFRQGRRPAPLIWDSSADLSIIPLVLFCLVGEHGDVKIFLLLAAVWCWGLALSPIGGALLHILLGAIGTGAFIWLKQIKPNEPKS
jgi:hypothetical protein